MAPPVRFAKTIDGGDVAFVSTGNGYPLLDFPISPNINIALEWEIPKVALLLRELAAEFRLIRLEARGLANSSAAPPGRKLVDFVQDDIDAVARALNLDSFALMTYGACAEIALRYAAAHSHVVTHVVLNNPLTHDLPWTSTEARAQKDAALRQQAEVRGIDVARRGAETMSGPDSDEAAIEALARVLRTNETPKAEALWEKVWEQHHALDLKEIVPHVRAKVVVTSNSPFFDDMARELAASASDSVLALGERSAFHTSITPEDRRSMVQRLAEVVGAPQGGVVRPKAVPDRSAFKDSSLSPRERDVLRLIAEGLTTGEIAEALVVSRATASKHIANIYSKLGIHNRVQAAQVAGARNGHHR